VRPSISVAASDGSPKQSQEQTSPRLLWLVKDKLYVNTYYNAATSVYILPGDVVTILSGGQTNTIPVDKLVARLYADKDLVAGEAPASAPVRVVPEKDRASRKEVVANATGGFAAANPYTVQNAANCSESAKSESLAFGDIGRVFVRHPDGNEVFTTFYTRALHALENEDIVWLTGFVLRGIDWPDILPGATRSATVAYAPSPDATGSGSGQGNIPGSGQGKTADIHVYLDAAPTVEAVIRSGGTITATYLEGANTLTRPVTLTLRSLALLTASPDTDVNTIAGVGPINWLGPDTAALADYGTIDWSGKADLKTPLTSSAAIPHGTTTAYPPVQFKSGTTVIPLQPDYRGTVSFVDPLGNEIYTWWGVTNLAYQVQITRRPWVGDTKVCGKVKPPAGFPAAVAVNVHDLTGNPVDTIIGTGTSDDQGLFCVNVSPPLHAGQVILAEVSGSWSQPAVATIPVFLPLVQR